MKARVRRQLRLQRPVATALIAVLTAVIVLIVLSVLGSLFQWYWTGLGSYSSPPHPQGSDLQQGKTLWDWLQLLIIPAVLATGGYWFTYTTSTHEREATKQRAQTAREIATDTQQEEALQAYIDKMAELLLHERLRDAEPNDEVRKIARVRTLTILPHLDGERKGSVLQFLYESGLIHKDKSIVELAGANLEGVDLEVACPKGPDLVEADLRGAHLWGANLQAAQLQGATLQGADLWGATLQGARLQGADLQGAHLWGANLWRAQLQGANLLGATLCGAYLWGADLEGAKVTQDQLEEADLLTHPKMPDGEIHP